MTFAELPIGAWFEFRGQRFQKLALSLAETDQRVGTVFQSDTEITPVDPPD